jgi:hypothetical protein
MSSSRSIAAARQKRAGEQSSNTNNNTGRPVTSISSSSVFSQQPQQPQQSRAQTQQGNVKYNQSNSSQARQMSGQNQAQPPGAAIQNKVAKISISDAIGLITLRLGKLEQFIQNSLEDGGLSFNNNNNNNNGYDTDNMKLVSDEVFENITNRLDNLEKKVTTTNNNNTNEQITKINKDVKDVKDSINTLNMKLSSFISESQERFMDFETAIVDIEKSFDVCNNGNEYEQENGNKQVEQNGNIDIDTENIISETIEDSVNTTDFNVDNCMQDE